MYHIIGNERGGVSQACVQYQLRRPLAYPNFRVIFIPDRGDHETLLNLSDTRRFPPPPFPFRFEKSSSAPKFLKNFINIIEFIARNDPRSNISNPNSFSNLFSFVCLNTRRNIVACPSSNILDAVELQEVENWLDEGTSSPVFKLLVTGRE